MAKMSGKQFDQQIQRLYRRRFGPAPSPASSGAVSSADRQQEIAELAEAVAEEHCPGLCVHPPAIARAKRITLSFGQYGDAFDGMLEYLSGRFHIYCNLQRVQQADAPRARFTLAHELGHYYIDEHRLALTSGNIPAHGSQAEYESSILAEQEGAHFASHLLMPQRRLMAQGRSAPAGLAGVLHLARIFQTSVTAMAIRYAQAEVRPCAVVKWDWRGYAWKHLSTSTFRACFRTTFTSPEDLAEGSPTRRALARETPPACGYFQAATVASAWFPRIQPNQWRDILFIEQAMPLGRYGVLTFLYPESGRYGSDR